MGRGKAINRHHTQRVHNKWRKRLLNVWGDKADWVDSPGRIDSMAQSMPKCSSPFCCGNERRQRGKECLTVQERRYGRD